MRKIKKINKKIVDITVPLENENHEKFCQEYVELDVYKGVGNARVRRGLAYRAAFPGNDLTPASDINRRAMHLLSKDVIKERLEYIYEQEGSPVEYKWNWTRMKAEAELRAIIGDEDAKPGERIKAVEVLNKMRAFDKPEESEDATDEVTGFLEKLIGRKK